MELVVNEINPSITFNNMDFCGLPVTLKLNTQCSLANMFMNTTGLKTLTIIGGRVTSFQQFCENSTVEVLKINTQLYRNVSFNGMCNNCINLKLVDMEQCQTDLYDCDIKDMFSNCIRLNDIRINKQIVCCNTRPQNNISWFKFVTTDKQPYDYIKQPNESFFLSYQRNQLEISRYELNGTGTDSEVINTILPAKYYYLPVSSELIDCAVNEIMFRPFPDGI